MPLERAACHAVSRTPVDGQLDWSPLHPLKTVRPLVQVAVRLILLPEGRRSLSPQSMPTHYLVSATGGGDNAESCPYLFRLTAMPCRSVR